MRKITITAAFFFIVLFSSCGKSFYIYNWTYYTPESVIKKFEKEFNVRVKYDEFNSNEEMFAKLKESGSVYDIVFPSGDFVAIMIGQNMLEKLDKSLIPNMKNIDPAVLAQVTWDPDMDYAVPYYYGAAGIIVNTSRVPNFQRSWSIFGRTDLRNRMTMLDDIREVFGSALVYLGYSINTVDPAEVEAAKNLINAFWKPNLVKFDSESFGKGFANGDFWVVHGFPESVFEEISDHPELMKNTVFFIPNEGGPSYVDNMVILKGSKNVELAHQFINFIHRPEIYAEFLDDWGFPSTVNIPARRYKTGESWYTIEDLENTELSHDLGQDLDLYTSAWFNSIRVD
jgi:spermidine/putrescine transport system substrate-binding protein